MGPVGRRAFLRAGGTGVAACLAGCSLLEESSVPKPDGVAGRVLDADGAPVGDASVAGVAPAEG